MLSLLPQLLFLAPLGTTLLRVVVACYFAYIAWFLTKNQPEITHMHLSLIGHAPAWILWLSALIMATIAALLFVGAWTQVIAILGAIITLKCLIGVRWFPTLVPFSASTSVLLFCMCLSLVVTGAGAFAFDLPL